jgi:hypothetical protein
MSWFRSEFWGSDFWAAAYWGGLTTPTGDATFFRSDFWQAAFWRARFWGPGPATKPAANQVGGRRLHPVEQWEGLLALEREARRRTLLRGMVQRTFHAFVQQARQQMVWEAGQEKQRRQTWQRARAAATVVLAEL